MKLVRKQGFTMVELIVALCMIATLGIIVLFPLNPIRKREAENNNKRKSDVQAIRDAVHWYMNGHNGTPPSGITSTPQTIEKNGGIDLCTALVPTTIGALPVDPLSNNGQPVTDCSTSYNTNYSIMINPLDKTITIAAPKAELGASISVTQ